MNELDIIKTIKNTLSDSSLIGDDTAFLSDFGLVATQDTLIEDVHFRLSTTNAYDLGIKSVAVNLSDLAAAGAIPKYLLISLSLAKNLNQDFIKEFYRAINFLCQKYDIKVAGGDITGSEKVVISICALGAANNLLPAKRSNAKIDDIIFVSGEHGSSYAGFLALENNLNVSQNLIDAHLKPVAHLELGRKIVSSLSRACLMDSSDGLADAVFKISQASNLSAVIEFENVPFNKEIIPLSKKLNEDYKNWILFGGEDYQLIGTASEKDFEYLVSQGAKLFRIGKIKEKTDHYVSIIFNDKTLNLNEKDIKNRCFNHFDKGIKK